MNATPCAACSTPVADEKPPPIVLNVGAIEPAPITLGGAREVDWLRVVGLPPFQMFLGERRYLQATEIAELAGPPGDAKKQAFQRLHDRLTAGPGALWVEYCAWHASKGFWPNETPSGDERKT